MLIKTRFQILKDINYFLLELCKSQHIIYKTSKIFLTFGI